MSTVRRDGVEFEVTLRRSGAVRLRHRDGDAMVDHGDVCRWESIPTPRIAFVRLFDGIFPPRAPEDRPPPVGTEPPRQSAPGYVVDKWLAVNRARVSS